mmetsp:Transcript_52960/g.133301  ORF Transcript_52960/g.133301 Transcript_52960/m.133301 type:complete len:312 (-) Transcript_52960:1138-2073(-)
MACQVSQAELGDPHLQHLNLSLSSLPHHLGRTPPAAISVTITRTAAGPTHRADTSAGEEWREVADHPPDRGRHCRHAVVAPQPRHGVRTLHPQDGPRIGGILAGGGWWLGLWLWLFVIVMELDDVLVVRIDGLHFRYCCRCCCCCWWGGRDGCGISVCVRFIVRRGGGSVVTFIGVGGWGGVVTVIFNGCGGGGLFFRHNTLDQGVAGLACAGGHQVIALRLCRCLSKSDRGVRQIDGHCLRHDHAIDKMQRSILGPDIGRQDPCTVDVERAVDIAGEGEGPLSHGIDRRRTGGGLHVSRQEGRLRRNDVM